MKKFFSTRYSAGGFSFAILIMRLVFGGTMIPIGYYKFTHFATLSVTFTDPFHFGHTPSLVLVIFAEIFCAGLVVLGLFTRPACIPVIITLCVVVFNVYHGNILNDGKLPALFLAGYLALLFTGPGKISMDRLIGK